MSEQETKPTPVPVVDTRTVTDTHASADSTSPKTPVWATQMVDVSELKPIEGKANVGQSQRPLRRRKPGAAQPSAGGLRGPVVAACFFILTAAGGFVLYQADVQAGQSGPQKDQNEMCFGESCTEQSAATQARRSRPAPVQLKPEQKTLVVEPTSPVVLTVDENVTEIVRDDNGKATQMQCTGASEVLAQGRAKLVMVVASYCKNCKRLLRQLGASDVARDVETVVFSNDYFASESQYRAFEKRTIQAQRKILWALGNHRARVYLGGFEQHAVIKALFGDPPAIPVIMVVDKNNQVIKAWQTGDPKFVDEAAKAVRELAGEGDEIASPSGRIFRPHVAMACEKPVPVGMPVVDRRSSTGKRRGHTQRIRTNTSSTGKKPDKVKTPDTGKKPDVDKTPDTVKKPGKKPGRTRQPADIKPRLKPPVPAKVDHLDW